MGRRRPVSTAYTLRIRCRKRYTCACCGCDYTVFAAVHTTETGRTREVAARAGVRRMARQLTEEPSPVPCPDCGRVQPNVIGRFQHRWHGHVTIVGFVFVVLAGITAGLLDFSRLPAAAVLAVTALGVTVAHAFVASYTLNSRPAEGRKFSRRLEDAGELEVHTDGDLRRSAVLTFTRWHFVGLLACLVATGLLLTPLVIRPTPKAVETTTISAGLGDRLRVDFDESVASIGGHWRGVPSVIVLNADATRRPPPINVLSRDTPWPNALAVPDNKELVTITPWAELYLPDDTTFSGRQLDLKVELDLSYPVIEGQFVKDRQTRVWKSLRVDLRRGPAFLGLLNISSRWLAVVSGLGGLLFAGLYLRAIGNGLSQLAVPCQTQIEEVAVAPTAARDEPPTPSDPRAAARLAEKMDNVTSL